MRLETFDPETDDARREACREIREACRQLQDPGAPPVTADGFRHSLSVPRETDRREIWLAADDTGPAGYYGLFMPGDENPTLAVCSLFVTPGRRRRGVGTALLAHCAGRAHAAGRTTLHSDAMAGSPGEAFARAAGAVAGLEEVRRGLAVGDGTAGLLARLRERAQAAAGPEYAVTRWAGRTPEADLDQLAELFGAMADAPRDDGVEQPRWNADLVRLVEERELAAGAQLYQVAARHLASGRLAALSVVTISHETPELGTQNFTMVARPHRGHRLGMLVKTTLYEWLTRTQPRLREFRTWNADTNQYMGAINEELGFRVTARFQSWELPVADLLSRAGAEDPA